MGNEPVGVFAFKYAIPLRFTSRSKKKKKNKTKQNKTKHFKDEIDRYRTCLTETFDRHKHNGNIFSFSFLFQHVCLINASTQTDSSTDMYPDEPIYQHANENYTYPPQPNNVQTNPKKPRGIISTLSDFYSRHTAENQYLHPFSVSGLVPSHYKGKLPGRRSTLNLQDEVETDHPRARLCERNAEVNRRFFFRWVLSKELKSVERGNWASLTWVL